MESELLKTFDEHGKQLGVATREEVHKKGLWHETFHCWLISEEEGKYYIFFQLRSAVKKDYPNLLDITAAGHILANETVVDGVREVKEEIGLEVSIEELYPLGVIKYSVEREELIDKELANIYLYDSKIGMEDFKLQLEEVSGIFKLDFNSFYDLYFGDRKEVKIEGFEVDHAGEKIKVEKIVDKDSFVPHHDYYKDIINLINSFIQEKKL